MAFRTATIRLLQDQTRLTARLASWETLVADGRLHVLVTDEQRAGCRDDNVSCTSS